MDKAKASVKDFLSKSGHHDTTVHEQVAPAVQNETVIPTQHERVTSAVEKESHQDHYHTSVQPVQHTETLNEQHHHNIIPVEHRKYEHDDAEKVKQTLANEQAQFRDTSQRVEGEKTTSVAPVVAGEHVHHHVHETIQPVVQKQTIEPHVVHTTVPIHEVHHHEAKHHAASALPAMSMDDFKKQGGTLMGDKERHDQYDGCPPAHLGGHQSSTSAVPTTTSTQHTGTSALPSSTSTQGTRNPGLVDKVKNAVGVGQSSSSTQGGLTSSHGDGPLNSHKHDPAR